MNDAFLPKYYWIMVLRDGNIAALSHATLVKTNKKNFPDFRPKNRCGHQTWHQAYHKNDKGKSSSIIHMDAKTTFRFSINSWRKVSGVKSSLWVDTEISEKNWY